MQSGSVQPEAWLSLPSSGFLELQYSLLYSRPSEGANGR